MGIVNLHELRTACFCCARQVNVVQSLLRAILALRPLPPLPVDLLGALAVGFNAWHTVLPVFEYQVRWGTPTLIL